MEATQCCGIDGLMSDPALAKDELWRRVAVAIPYLWLLVFFLAPFAIIFKISLADPVLALPPYSPSFDSNGSPAMSLDNFSFLLSDKLYAITYLRSVVMALLTTLLCLFSVFRWRTVSPGHRRRRATCCYC